MEGKKGKEGQGTRVEKALRGRKSPLQKRAVSGESRKGGMRKSHERLKQGK